MQTYDYAVVGGGIVGLAVAWALARREPSARLVVIEKEPGWARHQTGRNSGVIHAGIYYRPGSLKARLSREGNQSMVAFCRAQGIPHEVCGKVIVATGPEEKPLLEALYQRGLANGLELQRLVPEAVREIEPHVRCVDGVRVVSTGIVNYRVVCEKLAGLVAAGKADLRLNTRLLGAVTREGWTVLETNQGEYETRFLINCAGLHSDRVARSCGAETPARIVPFRGEYYEIKPERRSLVRNLIYPVPNPDFPFLGVHFTRMIDGSVHAGPNAVLSLKREGYHRTAFNWRDARETLLFWGFWRLAAKNAREGLREMHRSFSKQAFVRSLQRLVPDIGGDDLVPGEAGVRAQALAPDGRLVDDFLFVRTEKALHVCNAPSPAATAALAIAESILEEIPAV
ncbi:MAG: L-2-hydroxyglutarate oxidase [Verrucomicrobia bacterium]|nr:L-2-hydroxyglutarate oxidase [Verrucomicrobiota bacterium]